MKKLSPILLALLAACGGSLPGAEDPAATPESLSCTITATLNGSMAVSACHVNGAASAPAG